MSKRRRNPLLPPLPPPLVPPPEVSAYLALIGARGGRVSSWKKGCAARKNANKPCAPGKKRGRPPKPPQP